jgi:hypothetical protein
MKSKRLDKAACQTWSGFRMAEAENVRLAVLATNKDVLWNTNWIQKAKILPTKTAVKAVKIATGWRLRRCLATVKYIKRSS